MRYQKKRVEVEAVQWDNSDEAWKAIKNMKGIDWWWDPPDSQRLYIATHNGSEIVFRHDFVVQDMYGFISVENSKNFHAMYELVKG